MGQGDSPVAAGRQLPVDQLLDITVAPTTPHSVGWYYFLSLCRISFSSLVQPITCCLWWEIWQMYVVTCVTCIWRQCEVTSEHAFSIEGW